MSNNNCDVIFSVLNKTAVIRLVIFSPSKIKIDYVLIVLSSRGRHRMMWRDSDWTSLVYTYTNKYPYILYLSRISQICIAYFILAIFPILSCWFLITEVGEDEQLFINNDPVYSKKPTIKVFAVSLHYVPPCTFILPFWPKIIRSYKKLVLILHRDRRVFE